MKTKLFRIATIPLSLNILLRGQLSFLNRYYDVTAISGDGPDLDELRHREKVKTHPIEIKRRISLWQDIVTLIKLYLYFKKHSPSIVHSFTPKAGLLSMIAAKWAGVPVRMHTFTGLIFPTQKGGMKAILIIMDRLLCRCATNVYPEGKGVQKDLEQYRITNKPLKILANGNINGIDLEYFDPHLFLLEELDSLKDQLGISSNDFVFIFVGRLVKDKGIDELIASFQNLKVNNCKLLLVGAYEIENNCLSPETITSINKDPSILAVGFQKDVRPYFAIADCFVFPSYREGFPNVLLQAGAMNLPAIVTDINGSNEIIINGVNGIVIPVQNANILRDVMYRLFTDEAFRQKLSKEARQRIADRYQQREVLETLLSEYKTLEKNVQRRV